MIIGLCGFQDAGKDTIANYLIKEHGFKHLSFASVLKDIVAIMFDWDRTKLDGISMDDCNWMDTVDKWWANELNIPNLTPKYVLQYFGTELFRNNFHSDIWVKILKKQLAKYDKVVISDCRFENEINMLKYYGSVIIQIYRTTPIWFDEYKKGNDDIKCLNYLHPSEYNWIRCHCDFKLYNTGSILELHNCINQILNKITA